MKEWINTVDCNVDWEAFLFELNFLGLSDWRLGSSSSEVGLLRLLRFHGML